MEENKNQNEVMEQKNNQEAAQETNKAPEKVKFSEKAKNFGKKVWSKTKPVLKYVGIAAGGAVVGGTAVALAKRSHAEQAGTAEPAYPTYYPPEETIDYPVPDPVSVADPISVADPSEDINVTVF